MRLHGGKQARTPFSKRVDNLFHITNAVLLRVSILVVLVVLLAPVAVSPLPAITWDTVPVATWCGNFSGPLSQAAAAKFASR